MKIRELRKKTKLTQTQFGDLFGIPMRTIQEWECENRKPPEYVVNMIEELLYRRGLIQEEMV